MTEDEQREITRVCAETGLLLMQYGAESTLAEMVTKRVGTTYGVSAEVAITANALTITTLNEGHCLTTVRRILDRGINMSVTTEVQRIMFEAESGKLTVPAFLESLRAIKPFHYPKAALAPAIGASCAGFGYLAHADLPSCGLIFVAATAGMAMRLYLTKHHFRPLVSFFIAAFVVTVIAAAGVRLQIGATPKPAMAAPVLLFVPGFPLINGISDMVKGHINVGLSRMTMAFLLSACTCAGVILGMTVTNVWGWL